MPLKQNAKENGTLLPLPPLFCRCRLRFDRQALLLLPFHQRNVQHKHGCFVLLAPHLVRHDALSAPGKHIARELCTPHASSCETQCTLSPTLCTRTTGHDDHHLVVMDDVYAYMQACEKKAQQKAKAECMCGGNTHEESGHGNMDAFPYACTV